MNRRSHPAAADASFTIDDLLYDLPEGLIAQRPAPNRDAARMLRVDRATGGIKDDYVSHVAECLDPGDLVVLNDTKVVPAKFHARRQTGGSVPGLFVAELQPGLWRVLLQGSRRLRVGETLSVSAAEQGGVRFVLLDGMPDGHWRVRVEPPGTPEDVLARVGRTPLPPYIRRTVDSADAEDRARYQTVYASVPGAIAAPTAGLHLTATLLEKIRSRGIDIAFVTLHVGIGTFKPIDATTPSDHVMHEEWYEVTDTAAEAVDRCRRRGGRVVAVGTTCVRVLESAATGDRGAIKAGRCTTDLFIYPPYTFRVVDTLMTNFHLPRSTLLALVMAFAGVGTTKKAYQHAIRERYRFYSYGDAMLIQ